MSKLGKKGVGVTTVIRCKWCGKPEEGNAGDYYHEMACHRKDVLRRIDKADPNDLSLMARLQRELFRASYTGD